MRARHGLPIALALACLLATTSATAASSIAGKPCVVAKGVRTVGGKRFICTKSAGRLRWVLQSRTPTPVTTIRSDSVSPVVLSGYKQLQHAMTVWPDPDISNLQLIVDPAIPTSTVDLIKGKIKLVIRAFGSELPAVAVPVRVYVYNTKNFAALERLLRADLTDEALEGGWLDAKLQRAKLEPDYFYGGAAPGYGKDGAPVLAYYLNKNSLAAYDVVQSFAHEYVHVVQRYALANMARMTCWIREGQATYLGYVLAASNDEEFRTAWLAQYQWVNEDSSLTGFFTKSEKDWTAWLVEQETRSPADCDGLSNYVYGSIVWSYLYGTYGPAKTNTFLAQISRYPMPMTPPGDAWKQSFKSAFGETPETAYPRIAAFMAAEAIWVQRARFA